MQLSILKKISIVLALLFSWILGKEVKAQQQGQYSQYMFNYFLINPAVAGTEDYTDIRSGYRKQWSGLPGAPQNYYITAHTPLNRVHTKHDKKRQNKMDRPHHVIGAMATGQKLGALSQNSAYLTYAYHLPLTKKWTLSMGASAGMVQYSLNKDMLDFGDQTVDPAVATMNEIKPDLGLGIWLYSPKLFGGISTLQVFDNALDHALNRHVYLTGGYNIVLNKDWNLVPSLLWKTVPFLSYQIDVNAKLKYQNLVWAGISYRKEDAVVILAGVNIRNVLEIGYSYDITTSGLNKYSKGTHEIMLALKLSQKVRPISPSDFW